ncbi:FIG00450775: hypothetical protein [hydrothermal vent metagenome]|uniref:L,D-TPase catalytic domain-containing protein n=1 Tax=hydrothermal vent metagenome TaxID=652676 RepID=A0A3B0S650_9ZZZZ
MRVFLHNKTHLHWPGGSCRTAIGTGGLIPASRKVEGDGATPIGSYAFRRVLYRKDRVVMPTTKLPCRAIQKDDGWCDAPNDLAYNRPVRLPYPASAEQLFRQDHLYDILVVLGHNDMPPVPGLGSAIFLHLARPDFTATRGCLALQETDLREILRQVDASSLLLLDQDAAAL